MTKASPLDPERITLLLQAWMAGERDALDRVMLVAHAELRRLARIHMKGERLNHTLQPTALVNELYLRLVGLDNIDWHDRAHFFSMVSTLMRRVLVDAARARAAVKRNASHVCVTFDEGRIRDTRADATFDILWLNEAMARLAAIDARKARVVELRFFGGLSVEETARVAAVSIETVARDWRAAKIWLRRELGRTVES